MAVTITQPKSIYLDVNDTQQCMCKWSNTVSGQNAYEVMYKVKGSGTWSTLGKVSSTNTSADLRGIYNITNLDMVEYWYKIVVYYQNTVNNNTTVGKECSDVFSVIFKGVSNGYLKIYDGNTISQYPTFSSVNNDNIDKIKVNSNIIPLVDSASALASNAKIKTDTGVRTLAANTANFEESGQYGNGEFDTYVQSYQVNYATQQRQESENYTYGVSYTYYNSYIASYGQETHSDTYTYLYNYTYYNSYRRTDSRQNSSQYGYTYSSEAGYYTYYYMKITGTFYNYSYYYYSVYNMSVRRTSYTSSDTYYKKMYTNEDNVAFSRYIATTYGYAAYYSSRGCYTYIPVTVYAYRYYHGVYYQMAIFDSALYYYSTYRRQMSASVYSYEATYSGPFYGQKYTVRYGYAFSYYYSYYYSYAYQSANDSRYNYGTRYYYSYYVNYAYRTNTGMNYENGINYYYSYYSYINGYTDKSYSYRYYTLARA